MKRYFDTGCRIIKYRNYPKMLFGIIGIGVLLTGAVSLLAGKELLWPIMALGIYWALIAFQYPNINIFYSSQVFILWWGPFMPLKKRRGTFMEIHAIELDKIFTHNIFVSIKQEEWNLALVRTDGKKYFLMSFPSQERAMDFGQQIASDLMSRIEIKETPHNKVSPLPKIKSPFNQVRDLYGKGKKI